MGFYESLAVSTYTSNAESVFESEETQK